MEDGREDMMDLELNLGPSLFPSSDSWSELGSPSNDSRNIDDRLLDRIRQLEAVALRGSQRWRWRQGPIPSEMRNISMELIVNPANGGGLQTGEGSLAAEERMKGSSKTCKGNGGDLIAKALGKDEAEEKNSSHGANFFDCNICLDLASDPVLTSCGHLFCWPCLYQWLHVHSDVQECPVCKGEVMDSNITPIYGRGNTKKGGEVGLKIPPRPQGQRFESLRQSIHGAPSSLQMEEMIRRIGSRFNVRTPQWALPQDLDNVQNLLLDRPNSLDNPNVTSRELHMDGMGQNLLLHQNFPRLQRQMADLIPGSATSSMAALRLLTSQSQRGASLSYLSSALNSAERLAYVRGHPSGRNHTQPPPVEDRGSVSSTAAVRPSGSLIVDTAMEIDSTVSRPSSSSSRRRTDASRISDVDSGVSRATRRRRLQ